MTRKGCSDQLEEWEIWNGTLKDIAVDTDDIKIS
jgi:hypothetical protein